jgi:hypothetical protein
VGNPEGFAGFSLRDDWKVDCNRTFGLSLRSRRCP